MEEEPMTRRIDELNWEQFRDLVPRTTDLVLVPVGTIEAHGAIPLGTDTLIPEALANDLAGKLDALIAPAVAYGVTNSLLPYPGSTTVSSATFRAYLFEAAAGLVDAGFRRIVLLNGHGGQSDEVAEVVARLWNEKRAYAVAIEWWGLAEQASASIYPGVVSGHAGVEETAMVLAIAPDTIDGKRATTIRRAARRSGIRARPFPASIILDRPESAGEGAPILDAGKAKAFYAAVVAEIEKALKETFAGWDEITPGL
jgi:creatinine amidohydrolase